MNTSERTIYRARRPWTALISVELLIFMLCYWFFEGDAFFLLGPFLLYNLVIYTFPYWYSFRHSDEIAARASNGPKFQQVRRWAGEIFPATTRLNLQVQNDDFSNLMILAHGKTIWITTSVSFMELFSESETKQLMREIKELHELGRLQSATMLAALQFCLPIGIWGHNRGAELIFFSPNRDSSWQQLTFKVFHWQTDRAAQVRDPLVPCLFYPALTKYSPASYFSAYNFLRERVITSLKTPEDPVYGQQRDAHF